MIMEQQQAIPKPTGPSIAVFERMDKLQFVMEHGALYECVVFIFFDECKKIFHQVGNPFVWRRHVSYTGTFQDADIS